MLVKDVSSKTPMRPKPLSRHHIPHPQLSLCHVADVVPVRIHDDVFVGLLKPSGCCSALLILRAQ